MPKPFLPADFNAPDFYLAAMGRSGSTMVCNWLTLPPDQLVFVEPSFLDVRNTRLLRIQLTNFGMAPSAGEWDLQDPSATTRFERLMVPRLAGKRWGLKEVLCSEHRSVIDRLAPRRVLISVRNIFDVALSFFEKHRAQDNLHRFNDDWVSDYCLRESAGLLALQRRLRSQSVPFAVIRYEDFARSEAARKDLSAFLGWRGGGATDLHLDHFDRSFEVERHGGAVSPRLRGWAERNLGRAELNLAHSIEENCSEYQGAFGYAP
jgi:hypothetical protein